MRSPFEELKSNLGENARLIDEADTYAKVSSIGHFQMAQTVAHDQVHEALYMLRLFIGSNYGQIQSQKNPMRMGVVGWFSATKNTYVLVRDKKNKKADTLRFSYGFSRMDLPLWRIDKNTKSGLRVLGFPELTKLLGKPETQKTTRLKRAILWFGRATEADNKYDCFLMNSIAIESLLSEGRTSQESYAKQTGALFALVHLDLALGGFRVSEEFKKSIEKQGYFEAARRKMVRLFVLRNKLAHGSKVEIKRLDLLDYESLVRSAIIGMIKGDWESFRDYKSWFTKNYGT